MLLLVACSSQTETTSPAHDADVPDVADATTMEADSSLPDAGVADAPQADAWVDAGPCGLTLIGPSWSPTCQAWMDSNCCAQEQYCASQDQCAGWVACVNSSMKCGQISILWGPAYNCMTGPPDGAPPLPNGCSWP